VQESPPQREPLPGTLPRGVSVIVPVYGEGESLTELAGRISSVFRARAGDAWEIVLVNDGSPERCWRRIQELARRDPAVRGINLMRNYGQHNALLCGVRAARFDVTVTLDDDLQQPPEEIPLLLETLGQGWDLVYGKFEEPRQPLWRRVASLLVRKALSAAIGASTARRVSTFRAFRTGIRGAFAGYNGPFVSLDVLLSWGTTHATQVVVRHEARRAGASTYTFWKLASHAADMMTGFSAWPLRLASVVGFGFTLFGMAVLIYVIGRFFLEGGSVPGFPFLASIIAIFSGAQLFALGIIGEYLARMHFRAMDRPVYVVRETTSQDSSEART
jgi:undecaprenyl-phosphate 4-deoxy-4-formamido-L-arabinose transferase